MGPDAKDHFADCGPTGLAMILNAKGDPITPDQVYKFIGGRGASQYTSFTDLKTAAAHVPLPNHSGPTP